MALARAPPDVFIEAQPGQLFGRAVKHDDQVLRLGQERNLDGALDESGRQRAIPDHKQERLAADVRDELECAEPLPCRIRRSERRQHISDERESSEGDRRSRAEGYATAVP